LSQMDSVHREMKAMMAKLMDVIAKE